MHDAEHDVVRWPSVKACKTPPHEGERNNEGAPAPGGRYETRARQRPVNNRRTRARQRPEGVCSRRASAGGVREADGGSLSSRRLGRTQMAGFTEHGRV